MIVYFPEEHASHDPMYEYYDGDRAAYVEVPDRIREIMAACVSLDVTPVGLDGHIDIKNLEGTHDFRYISYLRDKCAGIELGEQIQPSNFIRDTYSPLTDGTYRASLNSAFVAMRSAEELVMGDDHLVYALCRPPGHHAENNAMAGYCYFNNAAIAANYLSQKGRVAILDIDYHHGNGTQSIFYDRSDVLYVSLHADPTDAFPYYCGFANERGEGKGLDYNCNFPLDPKSTAADYLAVLEKAISVVDKYCPDYVVLSLGFDTFEKDPIGGLGLNEATYTKVGELLNRTLACPMLIVQEGGYNISKLQVLARNFLTGLLGATK